MNPRVKKRATILDVAAAAGVSKSTVSNVVRGSDDVATATRERVLAAIAQLNYTPNAIARQFVTQRTTTLGVLVGDLGNPYYAQMARVVEREAFRHGYSAMFCNIEGDDGIAAAGVTTLLEHRPAGVVFLAFGERSAPLEVALRAAEVPIVFLGLSEDWGDSVGPQDADGGRLAVEHLLELGHTRVAYIRTPLVERSGDEARYAGYRDGLAAAGHAALPIAAWEPDAERVAVAGRTVTVGDYLRDPGGPTAVFVSNDIGAIAFMEACDRAGVAVPEQVSIVGFDDIAIAGLRRISLTTVAQPLDLQAATAVGLLLERIAGRRLKVRHVRVDVALRVRGSTAAPPASR